MTGATLRTDNPPVHRLRLAGYAAAVFLGSALLLVLEITAGRLLAPYVGVTLYSWTAIIGVILAGLSLGNWLGGILAEHVSSKTDARASVSRRGERYTGIALGLAGIFALASLGILSWLAPRLTDSNLDLLSVSFLYVLALFFMPSLLLGIPTPLLTTLALQLDQRTGRIVGRLHALAALGSIVGTFLTGFVLVQFVGSRTIVVLSSVLLLLLAAPFLLSGFSAGQRRSGAVSASLLAMATVTSALWVHSRNGFANPCDHESAYFCLRVVDASAQAPFGEARALVLDHLLHGINHADEPGMMISPYVQLVDELVIDHHGAAKLDSLSYFFAGGGAYTQPRAVQAMHPGTAITVAELDPLVTHIAERELFVDTSSMQIRHQDARVVLANDARHRYDVIVTDAFHDIAVPYHLVTREFMSLVNARLAQDGLYITNMVDIHPDPRLVKSYAKTLASVFARVDVWAEAVGTAPARLTYVIAASQRQTDRRGRPDPDILDARRGFERRWFRINASLADSGTPVETLPVLTDDFAPVESLISGLLTGNAGL